MKLFLKISQLFLKAFVKWCIMHDVTKEEKKYFKNPN